MAGRLHKGRQAGGAGEASAARVRRVERLIQSWVLHTRGCVLRTTASRALLARVHQAVRPLAATVHRLQAYQAMIESGIDFLDTAEVYG